MLDDRPYMRQSGYRPSWSAVTWLLGILVLVFVVQTTIQHNSPADRFIQDWLYLSRDGIRHGRVWQFLTFQFFHGGVLHLAFNGLFIFFIGRQIEEDFGSAGFWRLYLLSGVAGGILQYGLAEAFPIQFDAPVLGASAGASGLFAAFALLHPDLEMYIFPLPIPIRAKYLLWADIAWAACGIMYPPQPDGRPTVANGAHLGGILYALGFVYWGVWGNPPPWRVLFGRAAVRTPGLIRAPTRRSIWRQEPKPGSPRPPREYMSEEVDPILDKISAHGIHSLTDREKSILEDARNRMAKGTRP